MGDINQKVICIGWHKTGTSTMGYALLKLGYSVLGARLDMAKPLLNGDYHTPIKEAGEFQALQDVPWAALFKELDEAYPGSKFILTERKEKEWLNSALKHFNDKHYDLHEWLYGEGVMAGNEELYLERYRRHNQEVKAYFKDRPDDLLVMDLKAGDGWEKLCPFLGVPTPNQSFPHANKGKQSYNKKDKAYQYLRRFTPKNLRKVVLELKLRVFSLLGYRDPRNPFNNQVENRRYRGVNGY
jgi:hypothetical protein